MTKLQGCIIHLFIEQISIDDSYVRSIREWASPVLVISSEGYMNCVKMFVLMIVSLDGDRHQFVNFVI